MKSSLSKPESRLKIEDFFSSLQGKTPEQIRKIKRLAMHHHISLRPWKMKFCKKCFSVFNSKNSEIRIKNKVKSVKCLNCKTTSRVLLKSKNP